MKKIFILLLGFLLISIQMNSQIWDSYRGIAGIWDTITFENLYEYMEVDTSSQNIWQIGQPQKSVFESAYSSKNVIVTDTINSYPTNNYSYFDLKIGQFNYGYYYPYDIFIEFKHKYDTDTLKDGGYITVSFDKGNSWFNVVEQGVLPFYYESCNEYNLYSNNDSLYNSEFGFSGKSNGWETSYLAWYDLPCVMKSSTFYDVDTFIIRFNFFSDSIDSGKEGWMIDDIKLFSMDLGDEIQHPDLNKLITIFPNPARDVLNIRLNALYKQIQVDVYDLAGKIILNEIFKNSNEAVLSISDLPSGTYMIKVKPDNETTALKYFVVQ